MRRITLIGLVLAVGLGAVSVATTDGPPMLAAHDRTQSSFVVDVTGLDAGITYHVCVADTCTDVATLDPDPTPTPSPTATPDPTPACPSWEYGLESYGGGEVPGRCWRPFADSSPFNTPVPANPRLVSNSAQMVARIFGMDGNAATKYPQNMEIDPSMAQATGGGGLDYQHPTFFSSPGDPNFTIHCTRYACPDLEGKTFDIPAQARPADGGDGHLGVVIRNPGFPNDRFVLDLGQAWNKPAGGGTYNIGYGGISRVDRDGTSVDIDSAFNIVGETGQSEGTAARYSLPAGEIRPPHLQAGRIPHALFLVIKCHNGSFVYPAERTAGTPCADRTNAPPMGTRLWLDMTAAEIDALTVKATIKTMLKALAEFGAYSGDNGGGGYNFQFESPEVYHSYGLQSPLVGIAQSEGWVLYQGRYILKFDTVPSTVWDRLRVVDPCVSAGTC